MQQLGNVGHLNESLGERPVLASHGRGGSIAGRGSAYLADWSGGTLVRVAPGSRNFGRSPRTVMPGLIPATEWLAEAGPFATESDSPFSRGEMVRADTRVRTILSPSTQRSISTALNEQPESLVLPYLALVSDLLGRREIEAARAVLDAVPVDMAAASQVRLLKNLLATPRITVSPRRDAERTGEYRWIRERGHDYRGQWVAVQGDVMVAAAPSLKELQERLKTLRLVRVPLVHRLE